MVIGEPENGDTFCTKIWYNMAVPISFCEARFRYEEKFKNRQQNS
jgi:hypothetical protein